MGLSVMPDIRKVAGGTVWSHTWDTFTATVFKPDTAFPGDVINYGFKAPFPVVLTEALFTEEEAIRHAQSTGLSSLASSFDGCVVYVYPTAEGGWKNADVSLYRELIANTKIGPFYESGVLIQKDFFGKGPDQYYIRGAIFRVCLYGKGEAADYIAKNLLTTVNGQYLWGPGEITPSAVCLEGLSVIPAPERDDIAVISVNNSSSINSALREKCRWLLEKDEAEYENDWSSFTFRFKRWCGVIEDEPVFSPDSMTEEYGICRVKTTAENTGRWSGSDEHPVGYFAYYANGLLNEANIPVVVAFHGGGDSALHISHVSGWWRIAEKYRFLLICVENHMDVTASEAVQLIDQLCGIYPIDRRRIYATGFSMGGCKTWDCFQEYPEYFAALAPMDATFDVGLNMFGQKAPRMNTDTPVPVFYAGGEETPLPELPFQAEKCLDRIAWVFGVNRVRKAYTARFENREQWENRIWGINGDTVEKIPDASRNSILTLHSFSDTDGNITVQLASISPQGHECRMHTCEQAWLFMSRFSR